MARCRALLPRMSLSSRRTWGWVRVLPSALYLHGAMCTTAAVAALQFGGAGFLADPLWLECPRLLWEAASNLTSGVLFRDLALCSVVESPFAPRDEVFLEWQLGGRLARRGPLRRQKAEDGIAVTLDWAFLSVLPILDGASECIALGFFVAGVLTDVGLRLPHAHWIFDRKVKLRGMFRETTAVFGQGL